MLDTLLLLSNAGIKQGDHHFSGKPGRPGNVWDLTTCLEKVRENYPLLALSLGRHQCCHWLFQIHIAILEGFSVKSVLKIFQWRYSTLVALTKIHA